MSQSVTESVAKRLVQLWLADIRGLGLAGTVRRESGAAQYQLERRGQRQWRVRSHSLGDLQRRQHRDVEQCRVSRQLEFGAIGAFVLQHQQSTADRSRFPADGA